jgi:hypothetical protein
MHFQTPLGSKPDAAGGIRAFDISENNQRQTVFRSGKAKGLQDGFKVFALLDRSYR